MAQVKKYSLVKLEEFPDWSTDQEGIFTLSLVEGKEYACFTCPCGCGSPHVLRIRPAPSPSWEFSIGRTGGPTLSPSIENKGGCKSHFYIEDGKVRHV
jgi:hypothetical protein